MKKDELLRLIEIGESDSLEFKESFDKESVQTVGAFANKKGGTILIGVTDHGALKGIQAGKGTVEGWVNQISQSTDPRVIPEIESFRFDGKHVFTIEIKEFPLKPVSVKGKCFRRVNKSNRIMTTQEIAAMHYNSIDMSWDKLPAKNATLEDIDSEKIKKFISKAKQMGRRKITESEKPLLVLEKMDLIKDVNPTWAAFLLFRKDEKIFCTQSAIHCGRFKEKTIVIDDRIIEGTLIEQIDEAMDFIRKNITVKFVITGKPEREQIWEYPLDALREALINAVCHRDYKMSSNTEVRIYDDRLMIWNPGGLPLGITIGDLYKPHKSVLRNNGIGSVFYDMGLIEQWGSGIDTMRGQCKKAGLPEPLLEEQQYGFQVTFRKDIYTEEYFRDISLNDRQVKAVAYVKEHGKITNKEYRDMAGLSDEGARLDLNVLVKKEVLLLKGRGRSSHYILQ